MSNNIFGDRLRELLEEVECEGKEFAEIMHVQPPTVSNWLNGKRFPKEREMLVNIANFFEVTVDYLLGRTDDKEGFIVEKDELPLEVRELGIEYLTVTKELKEKGLSPNEIRDLAKVVNFIKEKNH